MVTVKFDVFGDYTRGKKAGNVNPRARVAMTYTGETVKAAIKKLTVETDGAFYKIVRISNEQA